MYVLTLTKLGPTYTEKVIAETPRLGEAVACHAAAFAAMQAVGEKEWMMILRSSDQEKPLRVTVRDSDGVVTRWSNGVKAA